MKNSDEWTPTKYVRNKKGQLMASRDTREVSAGSRFIADTTAAWYDLNIKEYAKGALLDLGCGKAPLYQAYNSYVNKVTLADWDNSMHPNKHLDVTCDITKKLPFSNNCFDTIILSDVLEHIPVPNKLMAELERILRPGGYILINVPFLYHVHEAPHDYHRYTEYMLQKLVRDANLYIVKLEALGGIYAALIDLLSKLWGGRRALFIQRILTRIYGNKLQDRKEFPIAYALVCQKRGKK